MQLIFKIQKSGQKGKVPVEVILKDKNLPRQQAGRIIGKETVENAEKILEGLDKIFKKSKIGMTAIKNIKTIDLNKNRYTSYRIVRSIEKALKLKIF
jgi:hypothetical protein